MTNGPEQIEESQICDDTVLRSPSGAHNPLTCCVVTMPSKSRLRKILDKRRNGRGASKKGTLSAAKTMLTLSAPRKAQIRLEHDALNALERADAAMAACEAAKTNALRKDTAESWSVAAKLANVSAKKAEEAVAAFRKPRRSAKKKAAPLSSSDSATDEEEIDSGSDEEWKPPLKKKDRVCYRPTKSRVSPKIYYGEVRPPPPVIQRHAPPKVIHTKKRTQVRRKPGRSASERKADSRRKWDMDCLQNLLKVYDWVVEARELMKSVKETNADLDRVAAKGADVEIMANVINSRHRHIKVPNVETEFDAEFHSRFPRIIPIKKTKTKVKRKDMWDHCEPIYATFPMETTTPSGLPPAPRPSMAPASQDMATILGL